jgi:hypothetical protein
MVAWAKRRGVMASLFARFVGTIENKQWLCSGGQQVQQVKVEGSGDMVQTT